MIVPNIGIESKNIIGFGGCTQSLVWASVRFRYAIGLHLLNSCLDLRPIQIAKVESDIELHKFC